jgi:hypothetical protein
MCFHFELLIYLNNTNYVEIVMNYSLFIDIFERIDHTGCARPQERRMAYPGGNAICLVRRLANLLAKIGSNQGGGPVGALA